MRGLEPGDLGWLVERHGVLYAREYGWDQSFERLVAQHRRRVQPRHRPRLGRGDATSGSAPCCAFTKTTRRRSCARCSWSRKRAVSASARTLVQEVIKHAKQRGYSTLTLWTNDVLHAARRIYEREGFTLQHEARAPGVRPRPRRADLVPYPERMDRDQLRALQAPLKAAYKDDPGQALITLKADGTLGEGISCSVDTGRAIAERRPAPRHRRRRHPPVLRRHAARGAGRLRRRHARRRGDRARTSRSTTAKSTPRATSTSEARWAWTKRRRSALKRSA